jgi:hypothetical protein
MKHEQIEICVQLIAILQAALYKTEELEDTGMYVHEVKRRTKTYVNFLEKRLNLFFEDMELEKSSEFIEMVNDIIKKTEEITLTIEE